MSLMSTVHYCEQSSHPRSSAISTRAGPWAAIEALVIRGEAVKTSMILVTATYHALYFFLFSLKISYLILVSLVGTVFKLPI